MNTMTSSEPTNSTTLTPAIPIPSEPTNSTTLTPAIPIPSEPTISTPSESINSTTSATTPTISIPSEPANSTTLTTTPTTLTPSEPINSTTLTTTPTTLTPSEPANSTTLTTTPTTLTPREPINSTTLTTTTPREPTNSSQINSSTSITPNSPQITLTNLTPAAPTANATITLTPADRVITPEEKTPSTTTTITPTTMMSTTVPVFEIPPSDLYCPPVNDTNAVPNSTDVSQGAVIQVTCKPPTRIVNFQKTDIFRCDGAHWKPVNPTCSAQSDSSVPVGIIVGCTLGVLVCLVLVLIAVVILWKSRKEGKVQMERMKEYSDKMDQIGSFINATFKDTVGMPALLMDTRDSGLRGRVTQSNADSSTKSAEPDPDVTNLGADLF